MNKTTVCTTTEDLRRTLAPIRNGDTTIGFVPTMGALHAGHRSLVVAAKEACDVVVVSIFVNPLQFAPNEDLDAYPRPFEADVELLEKVGVDIVFAPDPSGFTPTTATTTVHVDGLTSGLEASTRPEHFDGVTTIVAKLFNAVSPDIAYFGEKDFQQQAIIRKMVNDLRFPVTIVTCPLVRDNDGLALSSRNRYLSDTERHAALQLSQSLFDAVEGWDGDCDAWRTKLQGQLSAAEGVRLDYVELVDPETLEPCKGTTKKSVQIVLAAYVGSTRLIDTTRLPETP